MQFARVLGMWAVIFRFVRASLSHGGVAVRVSYDAGQVTFFMLEAFP
jgi:hypothetical protein